MLSQTSIVFWSLPAPYRSQAQKLSHRFHWWNDHDLLLVNNAWREILWSRSDRHALLREIWGRGRRDMPASLCKGSSKKALSSYFVWLTRLVNKRQTTIVVALYSQSLIIVSQIWQIYTSEVKMKKIYLPIQTLSPPPPPPPPFLWPWDVCLELSYLQPPRWKNRGSAPHVSNGFE